MLQKRKQPQAPQHHWHIPSWLCANELHGHEFKIIVSREFLDASLGLSQRIGGKKCQEYPRKLARLADMPVSNNQDLLTFGDYGLSQIKWPFSGGCWLELDTKSANAQGASYYAKNCDTSSQQSFLMAVWVWWAANVSGEIANLRKEAAEHTKGITS